MKAQWTKLALGCLISSLIITSHAQTPDKTMPQTQTQTLTAQEPSNTLDAANTQQPATTLEKAVPQTREEKIKAMVEENDKKAEQLKTDLHATQYKDKILAQNCKMAKNQLQQLMTTSRVKMKKSNGEMYYLSNNEKNKNIKEAREAIKRYCGQE